MMCNFVSRVKENFWQYYQDPKQFAVRQFVNLEKNGRKYSFEIRKPKEYPAVRSVLDAPLPGCRYPSLDAYLADSKYNGDVLDVLKKHQFKLIGDPDGGLGIVVGHPAIPKWLIKQNYYSAKLSKDATKSHRTAFEKSKYETSTEVINTCTKYLGSYQIPFWFYPYELAKKYLFNSNEERQWGAKNEEMNPLRVVTIARGRRCIKKFGLKHVRVPGKHLLPLTNGQSSPELYKKYVVIARNIDIENENDNLVRFAQLALHNPRRLETIVNELCTFILHTHIPDMHLDNIRFRKEKEGIPREQYKDQVVIIDGEPIGGVTDVSYGNKDIFKGYDYALFPLMGLRQLQNAPTFMDANGIDKAICKKVRVIFDRVINKRVAVLMSERRWFYGKRILSVVCPVIPLVYLICAVFKAVFKGGK